MNRFKLFLLRKVKCYSLTLLLFLSSNYIHSQSITVVKQGSVFVNDNSIGNVPFIDPSNTAEADGNYSVATTVLSVLGNSSTNYLKVSNFGFEIPVGALIHNVTIWITKKANGVDLLNDVTDQNVNLMINGSLHGNLPTTTKWTTANVTESYVFTSEQLGGMILDDAAVNNPGFGVAFSASYNGVGGANLTAEIDEIKMSVNYSTAVLPLLLHSFEAHILGNKVLLHWESEDTLHSYIIQRNESGNRWKDLKVIPKASFYGRKRFSFSDQPGGTGRYFYRLVIIDESGKHNYSQIRSIQIQPDTKIYAYPVPATNSITVAGMEKLESLVVISIVGKTIMLPIINRTPNTVQLDISKLSKGIYLVQANGAILQFVKK